MKKILLLATVSTLLGALSFFPQKANAEDNSQLVVNSIQSSTYFDEYAKNNYESYLMGMVLQEDESKVEESYILGTPFTIATKDKSFEKYNYPIIGEESGKIRYVLEISDFEGRKSDEDFSVTISDYLANILETLKQDGRENITLGYANGDLYVIEGDNPNDSQIVEKSPLKINKDEKIFDVIQDEIDSGIEPVVIEELIDNVNIDEIPNPQVETNKMSRKLEQGTTYSVIVERIYEKQDDLPWCAAYALSGAINFKEDRQVYTARDLMKKVYPSITQAQLNAKSLNTKQLEDLARSVGYKKTTFADYTTFSVTQVRNQINKQSPMILALSTKNENALHAVVLHGWMRSANQDFYYIWNPWIARSQVVNSTGLNSWVQYSTTFSWRGTFYDILK